MGQSHKEKQRNAKYKITPGEERMRECNCGGVWKVSMILYFLRWYVDVYYFSVCMLCILYTLFCREWQFVDTFWYINIYLIHSSPKDLGSNPSSATDQQGGQGQVTTSAWPSVSFLVKREHNHGCVAPKGMFTIPRRSRMWCARNCRVLNKCNGSNKDGRQRPKACIWSQAGSGPRLHCSTFSLWPTHKLLKCSWHAQPPRCRC